MRFVFYVLVFLAAFHFFYEGIIAPSLRLSLRFKLFTLRDRLRKLKMECDGQLSNEAFSVMQSSINNTIILLHSVNIELMVRAEMELEQDAKLRKRVERRLKVLRECELPEVQEMMKQTTRIMRRAVLINNGGWYVYIIPIFVSIACISKVNHFVKTAPSMPEAEVDKLALYGTPAIV